MRRRGNRCPTITETGVPHPGRKTWKRGGEPETNRITGGWMAPGVAGMTTIGAGIRPGTKPGAARRAAEKASSRTNAGDGASRSGRNSALLKRVEIEGFKRAGKAGEES